MLSSLRSLSIDISNGGLSSCNPLIDLPNLQHLAVAGNSASHRKCMCPGISGLTAALKSLILDGVWISSPTTFQSLSQQCEQLSLITISNCYGYGLGFTL